MPLAIADRRRSTRKSVSLLAHYDSKALELNTRVRCLSRTGVFLSSVYLDDLGAMVSLNLWFPEDAEPIRVAGRVVRVVSTTHEPGMGIRFTDLSWRSRQSISRFIEDSDSRYLS